MDKRWISVLAMTLVLMGSAYTQQQAHLLFAQRAHILRVDLDGSNLVTLVDGSSVSMNAVAIDFDYSNNTMYWSDTGRNFIMQAFLDGSNEAVIAEDVDVVDGLAWDWVNRKLYWTDLVRKTIEVLDPATGHRKVLINTSHNVADSRPRAIAVNPSAGRLYWTDWSTNSPYIGSASMDGKDCVQLVSTDISNPNGITINYQQQRLYWNDAGQKRLETVLADGSMRMSITSGTDIQQPFGITYFRNKLYWPEKLPRSIRTVDVNTPNEVATLIGLNGTTFGIVTVSSERQIERDNPCSNNNGGCNYLCLLSDSVPRGYTCACPDGVDPEVDLMTCEISITEASPTPSPEPSCSTLLPCENGGTCVMDHGSSPYCNCPDNFVGTFCTVSVPVTEGEMSVPVSVFVGVTGGLITVVILVLLLALCVAGSVMKRRKAVSSVSDNSQSLSDLVSVQVDSRSTSEPEYCSIKGCSPSPRKIPLYVCPHISDHSAPNHYSVTPNCSATHSTAHGLDASSSDDLVYSFKAKVRTL